MDPMMMVLDSMMLSTSMVMSFGLGIGATTLVHLWRSSANRDHAILERMDRIEKVLMHLYPDSRSAEAETTGSGNSDDGDAEVAKPAYNN